MSDQGDGIEGSGATRSYRHVSVDGWDGGPEPEAIQRLTDGDDETTPFDVRSVDPGDAVAPATHRGLEVEDLLLVLSGELRIETGDETLRVRPNEVVLVPPEPPARPVVAGDEPCRFLALGTA
ncbi:cupin domain-containing protein [Halobaculum limi]|uniref:cupin domain-containing protein n=1 Tax=Halobaculum limi TaxID=3031916 RepID=UPI0024069364|nr:cupin domain-containing protein [Halobaculum sp. YSMS11]